MNDDQEVKTERDLLEEQAQAKLAAAYVLLSEAAELAEKGAFTIEFTGGSYYPESLDDDDAKRVRATALAEIETEGWEDLDSDAREEIIDEYVENDDEFYKPEYAESGEWWNPSTC